jgi:hypothetical protein
MQHREAFLKTPDAGPWSKMSESMAFERAGETALLEMQAGFAEPGDPGVAAAQQYRMQGARTLLNILKNLTKPEIPKTHKPIGQLNHELK